MLSRPTSFRQHSARDCAGLRGGAARPAGERKRKMLMLLSERGVPLDYAAIDAKKDLKTLKEALGR